MALVLSLLIRLSYLLALVMVYPSQPLVIRKQHTMNMWLWLMVQALESTSTLGRVLGLVLRFLILLPYLLAMEKV